MALDNSTKLCYDGSILLSEQSHFSNFFPQLLNPFIICIYELRVASCYNTARRTVATREKFFLTTFRWLPFQLVNQNVRSVGGGVVKSHVAFPTNDNSASHRPCILIGQMQRKATESWRKDVKQLSKLSQTNKKLCPVATVHRAIL